MSAPAASIIDLAVTIELECAGLYEAYARCFSGKDEVVYFWRLYAEAERYHAATIRIHQASFQEAPVDEETEVPPVEALSFLDQLKKHRADAERKLPDIRQALEVAGWVEESSAELHARTQFFRKHPELADLFARMAEEDRAHRDVLKSAQQKFAGVGA
jgi:hypothetical protein